MKQETKVALTKFVIELLIFLAAWGLIAWLVEGNGWLHLILATIFTNSVKDKLDIEQKLKVLRQQFDIADEQLIYISQQVERLVEKEDEWDEMSSLKGRVDELEAERGA